MKPAAAAGQIAAAGTSRPSGRLLSMIGGTGKLLLIIWQEKKQKEDPVRTENIAVVIPMDAYSTNVPFFQECLLGISEMATMLRYNVLITIGTPNAISNVQRLVEKKQENDTVHLLFFD